MSEKKELHFLFCCIAAVFVCSKKNKLGKCMQGDRFPFKKKGGYSCNRTFWPVVRQDTVKKLFCHIRMDHHCRFPSIFGAIARFSPQIKKWEMIDRSPKMPKKKLGMDGLDRTDDTFFWSWRKPVSFSRSPVINGLRYKHPFPKLECATFLSRFVFTSRSITGSHDFVLGSTWA